LFALFTSLALRVRSRLAALGLCLAVDGNLMVTAIFGMAAFAQPAARPSWCKAEPPCARQPAPASSSSVPSHI
jgi:hypothetical protein